MLKDFLKILELMSFDEKLFIKELTKTLAWVPTESHSEFIEWLILNNYSVIFPDAMKIFNHF